MRATKSPIHAVSTWVRRQPPKVKVFLAVASGITALVLLKFIVHDHDNLFVAAESVHSIGISLLIYKLTKEKTCAGTCFDLFLLFFFFLLPTPVHGFKVEIQITLSVLRTHLFYFGLIILISV